jgi:predicted DNA-binding protein (MmcQ/YjbR family)
MDNISRKQVEEYILSMPDAHKEYPFGEAVSVYKIRAQSTENRERMTNSMFALMNEDKTPVNLSLRCDPLLSKTLRDKYDEVMPGEHLNKKHWITIVMSGQLSWSEIQDLIRHSYNSVKNGSQPSS